MKTTCIEDKLSVISTDASCIKVLTVEASEAVEPNSSDYFKLYAAYELAENQIRLTEEIETWLIEVKDKLL